MIVRYDFYAIKKKKLLEHLLSVVIKSIKNYFHETCNKAYLIILYIKVDIFWLVLFKNTAIYNGLQFVKKIK